MPRMARVRERLDVLVATSEVSTHLAADPLGFVHRAAPADREVVALLAATLAFGQVKSIRASIARVLAALGDAPARAVDTLDEPALAARLDGFVHRVYRGRDVARMLASAGALRRVHGTLGAYFAARFRAHGALREALADLADALRGGALADGATPSRGLAHLVPDPRKGSASKRLLLWLRWMVRPDGRRRSRPLGRARVGARHPGGHPRTPHRAQPRAHAPQRRLVAHGRGDHRGLASLRRGRPGEIRLRALSPRGVAELPEPPRRGQVRLVRRAHGVHPLGARQ